MKKYTLDTNLYIQAYREKEAAVMLDNYLDEHVPRTYLHSIVLQELVLGARNLAHAREIQRVVAGPFERVARILTPSYSAWRRSAEGVAKLVERKHISRGGYAPSFLNDVLLAVSCREAGVTLVTANTTDFERIAEVEPFDFAPPWPS